MYDCGRRVCDLAYVVDDGYSASSAHTDWFNYPQIPIEPYPSPLSTPSLSQSSSVPSVHDELSWHPWQQSSEHDVCQDVLGFVSSFVVSVCLAWPFDIRRSAYVSIGGFCVGGIDFVLLPWNGILFGCGYDCDCLQRIRHNLVSVILDWIP